MTAAQVDRVVVADRHPAIVVGPDGAVHTGARVVLTRDELFVWVVDGDQPRQVVQVRWELADSEVGRGPWVVATGVGEWRVQRGQGCGCSSPLKRLVPWTPWRVGRL